MRKTTLILLLSYAVLIVVMIISSAMSIFDFTLAHFKGDWFLFYRFALLIGLFSLSLAVVFLVLIQVTTLNTRYQLNRQLQRILANKPLRQQAGDEHSKMLKKLSLKMQDMTSNLQAIENKPLLNREEVVEEERKRVARDLHDTVSQELFAANMILSGLTSQAANLSQEQLTQQLETVTGILDTAQKDLRILLLHLRPLELEGKTLLDGFNLILQEVKDKSTVEVAFDHNEINLPKMMEAHIFRIAQEFINNTLRHAQAKHLEVYLYQKEHELQLRMTDDGMGYDPTEIGEVSYGLKNIRERVADMAGTVTVVTAPRRGVAMDIRVPLITNEEE